MYQDHPIEAPSREERAPGASPHAERREAVIEAVRGHGFGIAVGAAVLLFIALLWLARVLVPEREPSSVTLDLADERGTLSIITVPVGAAVLLESQPIGVTPLREHPLPEDRRVLFLRVEKEGFEPVDTVLILLRRNPEVFLRLEPDDGSGEDLLPLPALAEAAAGENVQERGRTRAEAEDPPSPTPPLTAPPGFRGATPPLGTPRLGSSPLSAPGTVREGDTSPSFPVGVGLVKRPAEAPAPQGTLSVLVRPWGSIYVNGTLVQRETDVRYTTRLPAGAHRIRVTHPTLGTWEQEVTLQAGTSESLVVDLNLQGGGTP